MSDPIAQDDAADIRYMSMALRQAEQAAEADEVPVGAVMVHPSGIVGRAYNQVELLKDPTAHAEILAITQAANALGDWRLLDTTLYITKEPCPMCAGAIVLARIPRVVWGMTDPKRGGGLSLFNILKNPELNHRPTIQQGVMEEECTALMKGFFKKKRQ